MEVINKEDLILNIILNEDDWRRSPRDQANNLLSGEIVEQDLYKLMRWPESQAYMDMEWFWEEAVLALGKEDVTGSSAYFIPLKYIL